MKRIVLVFLWCIWMGAFAQTNWQQRVDYQIEVSLNDEAHELDGFLRLTYTNRSPNELSFIYFHLWPNAYKNDETAFAKQQVENGDTDFYYAPKAERGYIDGP